MTPPLWRFGRLTKSYGADRGIVDVDLSVGRGQVMGLVGANGAGKTTLMRTLLDFIRPTTGTASVLGHDSRQCFGRSAAPHHLPAR